MVASLAIYVFSHVYFIFHFRLTPLTYTCLLAASLSVNLLSEYIPSLSLMRRLADIYSLGNLFKDCVTVFLISRQV